MAAIIIIAIVKSYDGGNSWSRTYLSRYILSSSQAERAAAMDRPFPLPLDRQLGFSLYGAFMAVNRTYKPWLDKLGLTYPQYLVLSVLWEDDDQTIGGIAARLDLEPSTITPLVKRLEQAGHVVRQRNPLDERQVKVRLTDRGRATRAETRPL